MVKKLTKEQKELGKKLRRLYKKSLKTQGDIKDLQTKCKHPLLKYRYQGNTGNYCPQDDCYWTEFYCPLCDKRWTEDQQGGMYERYPHATQHDNYGREPWSCQMLTDDQLRQS